MLRTFQMPLVNPVRMRFVASENNAIIYRKVLLSFKNDKHIYIEGKIES